MIDKKVLVEFLRLKWEETKWIWITIFGLTVIYFITDYFNNTSNYTITLMFMGAISLILLIIVLGLVLSGLSELWDWLFKWLKSNWKQAQKNVYPKKRRKK